MVEQNARWPTLMRMTKAGNRLAPRLLRCNARCRFNNVYCFLRWAKLRTDLDARSAASLWWTNSWWIGSYTTLRQIAPRRTTCAHAHTCTACRALVASVRCAAQVCSQFYTSAQWFTLKRGDLYSCRVTYTDATQTYTENGRFHDEPTPAIPLSRF